ncbi:putative peptidoglycan-binding domain-containing protein [Crocosphaera sp.]|uniref:putative peptidoglycan-binding domain-containing protein n=1 Tax=Crocosphaera sp. TaxID=2729996 RepID=UPI003F21ACF4
MNQTDFDLAVKFILEKIIQTETWNLCPSAIETYDQLVGNPYHTSEKLTPDKALDVYKLLYWDLAGCQVMPRRLAIAHFDNCIYQGVGGGIQTLQSCLGDIAVDGGFGPVTEQRLREYLHNYGEDALLRCYFAKRRNHYLNISDRSRSQTRIEHLNELTIYLQSLSQPPSQTHDLIFDIEKSDTVTGQDSDRESPYDSITFDDEDYYLGRAEVPTGYEDDSPFDDINFEQ